MTLNDDGFDIVGIEGFAAKLYRAKVYGGTDLAADLAGSDPINVIVDRFAEYWNRTQQATLLSAVAGATGAIPAEPCDAWRCGWPTGGWQSALSG